MNYNLAAPFYENSSKYADNFALSFAERSVSYSQLRRLVQPIGNWLRQKADGEVGRVGILASRSIETYAGILGTCWAGGSYVPISPKLPEDRLVQLLERVDLQSLIVDANSVRLLSDRLLRACPANILAPGVSRAAQGTALLSSPSIFGSESLATFVESDKPVSVSAEHIGYIEFTSGTTGVPKGVMIPAGGVAHFLKVMRSRFDIGAQDRIAGVAETTFDISVFDMFMAWSCGATLHVVPATQVMAPLQCIQQNNVTVAFTVPSVAVCMNRMKFLATGSMPSLKYSLFSGEPLPVSAALAWQKAASNSIVENLYGPTEATVVCTGQRFFGEENATPSRGVVAIGTPFPGMETAIIDSSLRPLPREEQGEIVISGPQLSSGYFADPVQTSERFLNISGKRWYRTGDLGIQDAAGTFHHLGRIDNQVKVRGMRVELEEIEAHLREIYQTDSVAALAWPIEHGSASGIVAFVGSDAHVEDSRQRVRLKECLPSYMVPTSVCYVEAIPLNANGKVNRRALPSLITKKAS
ncbi:MAG: amino acid adenylation domain-containing protein [Candidatus Acidiferrales bacterium]|jgi:D-alanine--poly(phosphoribitol) ligase subunit 1